MAEWAASDISGTGTNGHWEYPNQGWLSLSQLSLFKRSYSAVGFWSHVHSHGGSVWGMADDVTIVSPSSDNAYDLVLAGSGGGAELLATWGAQYLRDPSLAPAWDIEGFGIPEWTAAPALVIPITPGSPFGFEAAALGAAVYQASLETPAVTLKGVGHGLVRLPDGVELTLAGSMTEVLCTDPAGCSCADGTSGANAIFRQTLAGEMKFGATGHRTGTDLIVQGWTLEDFCAEFDPFPASCYPGRWMSTGYTAPDQQTLGGVGVRVTIDESGQAELDFGDSTPIVARLESPGALWVRMQQTGTSRFSLVLTSPSTAAVTDAITIGYTMTPHAFLDGGWVQTVAPINISGSMLGSSSQFVCDGDTLRLVGVGGIAEYSFTRLPGAVDPLPPPPPGESVEGGEPGDPGGGTTPSIPPGWGEIDPCTILTLSEVQTLAPEATAPTSADVLLTPTLLQCSFPGGLTIQVTPPQTPNQFIAGLAIFDLDSESLSGVGDWGVLGINKPDPQFGITDSVFLVGSGGPAGTVTLIPSDGPDQGSAELDVLIGLLQTALGRL